MLKNKDECVLKTIYQFLLNLQEKDDNMMILQHFTETCHTHRYLQTTPVIKDMQGTLTEGENSVPLTSSLKVLVVYQS
jgi:hypothetical protein